MAANTSQELIRFLSMSGKKFKWNDSLDCLLKLLQEEFGFTQWAIAKQDDKVAVIKGTNLTVNWYKSTKTMHIQGGNEEMVKKHLFALLESGN